MHAGTSARCSDTEGSGEVDDPDAPRVYQVWKGNNYRRALHLDVMLSLLVLLFMKLALSFELESNALPLRLRGEGIISSVVMWKSSLVKVRFNLDHAKARAIIGSNTMTFEIALLCSLVIFLLEGRFIFGPDARSLFLTIFLIVAPVSVFCAFVARKLMDDFSHNLGITIMIVAVAFTLYDLSLLLITSGRDPGIVPRNTHPPEPESYGGNNEMGGVQTPQIPIPRTMDVIVNGMTVKSKYCDTCMLYRPPRCSHCSICNNCVERFDHHCPWVGQCIGNTTYENFRYRYDLRANPYNRGVVGNITEVFFTSIPPSKNKFRVKAARQQGLSSQSAARGFLSPNMGRGMGDIEMGRKPISWEEARSFAHLDDLEGATNNPKMLDEKDVALGHDTSPNLSKESFPPESAEGRTIYHPRHSSRGRRSGSWEMTPDVLALAAGLGEPTARDRGSGTGSNFTENN
ncbi:hypothetical protein ZIOFF_036503 [Zingiber officinale]|uniref:S-acyltransferase n=1 Tax=Zingiber officinale TaxID=94328 RepID=A0A8J5GIN0_ZINOF|nr:hypothetical protein ZIOFF_036503 [Zingiber officinale]